MDTSDEDSVTAAIGVSAAMIMQVATLMACNIEAIYMQCHA